MKTIIKGMTLLLAGVMVMSCSKDVTFDENAVQQAQYEKKLAEYKANFVKHFGTIDSNHQWGFDMAKASVTRGEAYGGSQSKQDCGFDIPANITSQKNGKVGNNAQAEFAAGKGKDLSEISTDVDFVNYWLQHFNAAQGSANEMKRLEAFDGQNWITITNFEWGKNESNAYFTVNKKTKGTTLMKGMGGTAGDPNHDGAMFRWIDSNNGEHYNYKFLIYNGYLVLGFEAAKKKGDWWLLLVEQATSPQDIVEEGCIMCEDLGDTDDFDFNDVVFNAKRFRNGQTEITVLACGGTLPISVAGQDIHQLMGGTMLNTGVGEPVPTQTFTVSGYSNIIDIPVVVDPGNGAIKYALQANVGDAPLKICTPVGSHYAEEYVHIDRAYSEFNQWVADDDATQWLWVENERLTDLILSTK